jgi:hypothetical protein
MPNHRDPDRVRHAMFKMVTERPAAIACGHEDAIDFDRLRHDALMKVAVGRCPEKRGSKMGLEGIVSKRLSAPYGSGPSCDWIKVKNPDSPAMIRAREADW